ncbi:MAG: hypothetical protein IPJ69_00275 [Deltaproteobacteria bacterium]|nr:MAG: hypothetical protein IPJ69_00275 [Deltaproteobacteria bacterium]
MSSFSSKIFFRCTQELNTTFDQWIPEKAAGILDELESSYRLSPHSEISAAKHFLFSSLSRCQKGVKVDRLIIFKAFEALKRGLHLGYLIDGEWPAFRKHHLENPYPSFEYIETHRDSIPEGIHRRAGIESHMKKGEETEFYVRKIFPPTNTLTESEEHHGIVHEGLANEIMCQMAPFREEIVAVKHFTYDHKTHSMPVLTFDHFRGDLWLIKEEFVGKSDEALLPFVKAILNALLAVHQSGYIHRDIKPGNFLISDSDYISATDCSLAIPYEAAQHLEPEHLGVGTVGYLPSEPIMRLTPALDTFAFGASLLYLATPEINENSRAEDRQTVLREYLKNQSQ